jgi:hypothetical protein
VSNTERATLRRIREGKRLPATLATLEAMASLAEAGLVCVERDPLTRSPVRWIESEAGKAVAL